MAFPGHAGASEPLRSPRGTPPLLEKNRAPPAPRLFQPPPPQPASHAATHISDLPDGAIHAILDTLGPRDLIAAAATCRRWAALAADDASDRAWRGFFTARWRSGDAVVVDRPPVPPGARHSTPPPWRQAYGRRLAEASALAPPTRPAPDSLAGGHRGAARCVSLLPSLGLAASAGTDRVVRAFDLAAGMPLATSRQLPWAVRSLAASSSFLAAASGADARVALWRAGSGGSDGGAAARLPWDLTRRPTVLAGHTGPVAGLAASDEDASTCSSPRLFSASWDCSVRVWDAATAACLAAAPLTDWAWSALPRGGRLLCAEGRGAAVLDGERLCVLSRVPPFLSRGPPTTAPGPGARVEGTRDGRTLFIAHADGGLASYDLRAPGAHPRTPLRASILIPPGSPAFPPASSLAHDDPWLALGLGSAGVALVDTRSSGGGVGRDGVQHAHPITRRLGTGATAAGSVLGVDLAGPYLAAACSSGTVLTWRWDAVAAAAARLRARGGGSVGRARPDYHPARAGSAPAQPPPPPHVADCWEDAALAA